MSDNRILDPPKIRAMAETFYSQGAEGIMLYNFYVSSYTYKDYYPFLRDWIDPVKISSMSRHYFFCRRLKYVPTEHYSFGMPHGYAPDEENAFTLFPLRNIGDEAAYNFRFAGNLTKS